MWNIDTLIYWAAQAGAIGTWITANIYYFIVLVTFWVLSIAL